jgi:3'(2'), 5'-bisphosphate nucleotidase
MIQLAIQAALEAGEAILDIYDQDFEVEYKSDESPLTAADKAAHNIIVQALETTPYPVLSEESAKVAYDDRKDWGTYWLVDPLDGTKEFIKKNGEFTVNIALIEEGVPVLGIVYVPVSHTLYVGAARSEWGIEQGAWKAEGCSGRSIEDILATANTCSVSGNPGKPLKIVASKSHCNDETRQFISDLEKDHGAAELVSSGSSLKLCMVAEGSADIYPRIAPTMEWDTAAAHAVVVAAGGAVFEYDESLPVAAYSVSESMHESPCALRYNKENLLNPYFVVSGLHE